MLFYYVNFVVLMICISYTSTEYIYAVGVSGGKNQFYQIDSTTGSSTLLSTFTMPCGSYIGKITMSSNYAYTLTSSTPCLVQISATSGSVNSFSLSSSLSGISLQDLQYNANTNLLYILSYSSTLTKNQLWSLDPSTLTVSLIATVTLSGGYSWVTNVGGYE